MQRYGFDGYKGEISHTLVFMLVFSVISTIIGLPQSYYSNFVLEEKFGFNKQTPGLWVMDKIKGFGLGIVFGAPILSGFLAIIQKTGTSFFYYLWLFSMGVQVAAITIYPTLIQPLFNKLTPMETGELRSSVEKLAERLQFPLDKLYVIDGSKRSAHSNAYFYGLPWKKQIVIYDTLIEKSNVQEVTAVLGHELGHWSLGHVTKLFGLGQFQTFYIFALFSAFIKNRSLYQSFGFVKQQPIFIGFLLFNYVLGPLGMIVNLFMTIVTRTFEFQAGKDPLLPSHVPTSLPKADNLHPTDEFAVKLGYKTDLAKSLIRLQVENLSSMDADWMYASYHYSHPILPERLNALGWYGSEKVTDGKASDSEKPLKASDREL